MDHNLATSIIKRLSYYRVYVLGVEGFLVCSDSRKRTAWFASKQSWTYEIRRDGQYRGPRQ